MYFDNNRSIEEFFCNSVVKVFFCFLFDFDFQVLKVIMGSFVKIEIQFYFGCLQGQKIGGVCDCVYVLKLFNCD